MKVFAVLSVVVLLVVSVVAESAESKSKIETCQRCTTAWCATPPEACSDSSSCSASYSGALTSGPHSLVKELQEFTFKQLDQSFEFMLRASYFSNYKASRAGLAKLLRGLSDSAWEDAIRVAKLVAQRGGGSVFAKAPDSWWGDWDKKEKGTIAVSELSSLGRALDSVKHLAMAADSIHHRATHHSKQVAGSTFAKDHQHDAHIAHFIEEEFSGRYASEVRALAGHTNDLRHLLVDKSASEKSLSLFLFDEYLLKL